MISVAMTTYNGEKYIEEQLDSILEQTLPADEVIIGDDVSTDNTVEIIENFIKSKKLQGKWKLIKNPIRLGYIANFLHVITITSGDYIFLSDQDDYFYPTKFETIMNAFAQQPEALLINAGYSYMDSNSVPLHSISLRSPKRSRRIKKLDFHSLLYNSNYPGFSMAFHRKLILGIENVDLEDCYGHDLLLNLLAIEKNGCYEISDKLSLYRIHENNTSGQWGQKEDNRYLRRIEQKKKELCEYEKLEHLCEANKFRKFDRGFIEYRKSILQKRIQHLSEERLFPLLGLLLVQHAYPIHTVLGDALFILEKEKMKSHKSEWGMSR